MELTTRLYITKTGFDGLGNQVKRTTPDGTVTRYIYDELGLLVEFSSPIEKLKYKYDYAGRRTHTFRLGSKVALKETVYYKDGMIQAQIDARLNKTEYEYTGAKQLCKVTYPADRHGVRRTMRWVHTDLGKLASTIDPNGTKITYVVDDAGRVIKRSAIVKPGGGVIPVAEQYFSYDALGRLLSAFEGPATKRESAEYWAYDLVGRVVAEGHSFSGTARAGVASIPSSLSGTVERLVTVDRNDATRTEIVKYASTGLTVTRNRGPLGLNRTWVAGGVAGVRLGGSRISLPDGRLGVSRNGVPGAPGKPVTEEVFEYYSSSRRLFSRNVSFGGNRHLALMKYDKRGLVTDSQTFSGMTQMDSTFKYKPGRALPEEVTEVLKFHDVKQPISRITKVTNKQSFDPVGNQTAETSTTTTIFRGKTIGRPFKKDVKIKGFTTSLTDQVTRPTIDGMNRYLEIRGAVDGAESSATLQYDLNGSLSLYQEKKASGAGKLTIKVAWDAYGRLRHVFRSDVTRKTVIVTVLEGGSTGALQRMSRTTVTDVWYSATGRRLYKQSGLQLTVAAGANNSFAVLQRKGEWYTNALGMTLEETERLQEVRAETGALDGREETLKANLDNTHTYRTFGMHRQFIASSGVHAAMIRYVKFNWETIGSFVLIKKVPRSQHYILRDEGGSPFVLIRRNGQPEVATAVGYKGEILATQGEKRLFPRLWHDRDALNYQYLNRGQKHDHETAFNAVGSRYYWPQLGRFLSLDRMGSYFDPTANGGGYAYAAGNPAAFGDDGNALFSLGFVLFATYTALSYANAELHDSPILAKISPLHLAMTVGSGIQSWRQGKGLVGIEPFTGREIKGFAYAQTVIDLSLFLVPVGGSVSGFRAAGAYSAARQARIVSIAARVDYGLVAVQLGLNASDSLRNGHWGGVAISVAFAALHIRGGATARRALARQAPIGTHIQCFVAGTKVKTKDGAKEIERIVRGDLVLSRDPETGRRGYKRVLQAFVTHPTKLIHLRYRSSPRSRRVRRKATRTFSSSSGEPSGLDGDDEGELVGTHEHPFWSVSRQAWIPMGDLEPGETLLLASGMQARVVQSWVQHALRGQRFTTYNFEVEDWHTYFVAPAERGGPAQFTLVHNTGAIPCDGAARRSAVGALVGAVRMPVDRFLGAFRNLIRRKAGFRNSGLPFIIDSDSARRGMAAALRQRGFNVRTVREIFGGDPGDPVIKALAQLLGGRVLTNNMRDFGRDVAIHIDPRATRVDTWVDIIKMGLK
ncbi:hypothetical protein JYT84_00595 [bacterium AH-315-M10]|nr:hypothetical protein [bacterium AH-315-M10]